jgi:proteasome component ECM29
MGYLSKSKTASESVPSALQVSFDCLYGPKTNTKLVMAGMAFVQWIARMVRCDINRYYMQLEM